MLDLQRRLTDLGLALGADEPGRFGTATRAAVEAFQHRRGLRVDGRCGPETWAVLVEAGYRLGDRRLHLADPMLRGDDVAELQQRLSALGFDTGRVDGIFGPLTASAVAEFQRNSGQEPDGTAHPSTVRALLRVETRQPAPELVSTVRAREELRRGPTTLVGRQVAIGGTGGLGEVAVALHRQLAEAGARVTVLPPADGSAQAASANAAGADLCLWLNLEPGTTGCITSFYAGYRYESPGGRRLAELVQSSVPAALHLPDLGVQGMSVPVLRETRMPAIIIEIGPALRDEQAPMLVAALTDALTRWVGSPWD